MSILQYANSSMDTRRGNPFTAMFRKFSSGRNPWGLADQILISGCNFVTMVLAGRGMGTSGFGEFSLVYNVLLFANMIQMSLVTQPHNVLGTGRNKRDSYLDYTSSTAASQAGIAVFQALIAAGWVVIAHARGWHCAGLLLALVPAIVAWQLQEFVRRILYTEGRTAAAFANDVISYGGQAVWIAALWGFDLRRNPGVPHRLTGPAALYILAATSAAATVVGLFQIRGSLLGRIGLSACRENWTFGKWLLGSELLTWFSALPMYMNLVGWIVGASASGELKAAQTLFGPARVISFYLATVLPIQFARELAAGGDAALHRKMKSTAWVVVPTLGFFCLLIAIFAGPLLTLFGRDFAAHPRVLTLYAIVAFLTYTQMLLVAALTAKRLTRIIFFSSVWGSLVTVALSWPLIKTLGIDGALIGMILTGIALTMTYWIGYCRSVEAPTSKRVLPVIADETLAEISTAA